MNNEELDSQLSAMFDNELPPGECELLARRLSRDPDIKARWGRYAVIGAVIRAERGVALEGIVAGRVSAALSSEPALSVDAAQPSGSRIPYRWWQPIAGVGLAAGVAAVSILWLRSQALPGGPGAVAPAFVVRTAALAAPAAQALQNAISPAPDSFVVPPVSQRSTMMVPATELADYVVAHSAFSWPVSRGNLLSALMVNEPGTSSTPARSEQPASGVQGNAIQNPK